MQDQPAVHMYPRLPGREKPIYVVAFKVGDMKGSGLLLRLPSAQIRRSDCAPRYISNVAGRPGVVLMSLSRQPTARLSNGHVILSKMHSFMTTWRKLSVKHET